MADKTILITGAGGFTGLHACQYFYNKGYHVVALARQRKFRLINNEMKVSDRFTTIYCDLTNEETVEHMIKDVKPDYVLHTAGRNDVKGSWEDPAQYLKANVLATVYLLEGIRKYKKDAKILVIGSALEYDPSKSPNHPYGLTKTFQTLVAKSWEVLYKLPVIIAKPTNLIGPGPSTGFCSIVAGKIVKLEKYNIADPIKLSNPNQQRDFLDVRDAIRAYEILFKQGQIGEVYPIGTGRYRTLKEIIERFQRLSNVIVPTEQSNHSIELNQVKKDEMRLDKMKGLGWQPEIPFDTSLKDILSYFRLITNPGD